MARGRDYGHHEGKTLLDIGWPGQDLRYPIMSRVDAYCPPAAPIFGGRHDAGAASCWRARGLRDWLVMYTFAGACRIAHGGGDLVCETGDIAVIAPRVPQDYGRLPTAPRWGVLWVVFQARDQWVDWLRWPGPRAGIGVLRLTDETVRARVERHLDDAVQLSGAGIPERDLLAMNALEASLLWCRQAAGSAQLEPRLQRAVAFICEQLGRPIGLAAMARAAGVSAPHFSRLFRRHLGTSPQRFLEDRRLQRAGELLRATALPVQDIASQCGFASPFYFSSRFSRRFGVSPRRYRQQPPGGR